MSKSRVFLIAAVAALLFVVIAATGADKKLTDLTALVQADWATGDVLAIVDVSASSTKKTTIADFDARYFNESSVASVAQGGTGIASGTSGGVLAFSASGTIVSSGQLAQSQVVIGGGSGAAPSTLAAGSQYQVLRMGASVPAYGSINLDQAAAVTGVLPNANTTATSANTNSAIVLRDTAGNFNAGTISAAVSGNSSTATALAANPSDCGADTYATTIAASGNLTCSTVSNAGLAGSIAASKLVGTDIATLGIITSGTWTATAISAAYGGTGASTLTANNVILGNGTNPVQFVAPGTSGNVLTSNGTTWTSAAAASGSSADNPYELTNLGLSTSVAANALTISLKQKDGSTDPAAGAGAVKIGFRNATSATGGYSQVSVTAANSITIPSGTAIGTMGSANEFIYIYAINNAGAVELAVSVGQYVDEGAVLSTTAISGGNTRGTTYSTTARTNVPIRLIGRIKINNTTPGTWANNATEVSVYPLDYSPIYTSSNTMFRIDSAVVSSGGVVSNEIGDFISGNCTTTSPYTCTFTGNYYPSTPNCWVWAMAVDEVTRTTSISGTSVVVNTADATFTVANRAFGIACMGYK